jgi:uracil-DNA glycosylase family 4
MTLASIEAEVVECRQCPRLVAWREEVASTKRAAFADETYWGRPVPGFGDPAASVLIMGLAPAAHGANRTGRMFTGDRSGEWLYRAMHRAGLANQAESIAMDDGLELSGAWVTSPVKCAPPANKPTSGERTACEPFLQRELTTLADIRVVVGLGAFGFAAAARAYGMAPLPKFGHGVEVELPGGAILIGSYHVSQQNTFTGRLTEPMLDDVFSRAVAVAAAT